MSEAAVCAVERDAEGRASGVRVRAALVRAHHGRSVAELEKKADPPAPAPDAPFAEQMRHRTATRAERARYKLRGANRRTGLRDHQRNARLSALLPAGPGARRPWNGRW